MSKRTNHDHGHDDDHHYRMLMTIGSRMNKHKRIQYRKLTTGSTIQLIPMVEWSKSLKSKKKGKSLAS